MRPMCCESFKPRFRHVLPPSSLRYTPSPQPTLRWLFASPVPTQIVLGFFLSIVTVPIEYDPSFWKTGEKVMPALVVFHTPPEATPMYQVCLSSGCTAMTLMRPDIMA